MRTDGPVFICGSPRSGTTAVLRALEATGLFFSGSTEGHWMNVLLGRLSNALLKPESAPQLQSESSLMHSPGHLDKLIESLGICLDQYQREVSGAGEAGRWIDKTPDVDQIRTLPLLMTMFPDSKVVFTYRHPFDVVTSTRKVWNPAVADEELVWRWMRVQQAYETLIMDVFPSTRRLEVSHELMVAEPLESASLLASFLEVAEHADVVGAFFKNQRVNRAVPIDAELSYETDSDSDLAALVDTITRDELSKWVLPLTAAR